MGTVRVEVAEEGSDAVWMDSVKGLNGNKDKELELNLMGRGKTLSTVAMLPKSRERFIVVMEPQKKSDG